MEHLEGLNRENVFDMKCSECGSHDLISRGKEVFCSKCGMVLDDLSDE